MVSYSSPLLPYYPSLKILITFSYPSLFVNHQMYHLYSSDHFGTVVLTRLLNDRYFPLVVAPWCNYKWYHPLSFICLSRQHFPVAAWIRSFCYRLRIVAVIRTPL